MDSVMVMIALVMFAVFVGFFIISIIVDKIAIRFYLMPSTKALISSIIYFMVGGYFGFEVISLIFSLVVKFNFSILDIYLPYSDFYKLIVVVMYAIAAIANLIKFLKLEILEAKISNESSILKIIDLHNQGITNADEVAKYLELEDRNDYNELIPEIIENLKHRNILPNEIKIY